MFEVWQSDPTPERRVVVEEGGTLPPELGGEAFMLLGSSRVDDEISAEIARVGFYFYRSAASYDPDAVITRGA